MAHENTPKKIYEDWHNNLITFADALAKLKGIQRQAIKEDDVLLEASVTYAQGRIYAERQQYEEAKFNFEQAIELFNQTEKKQFTFVSLMHLAEIHSLQEHYEEAVRIVSQAKTLARHYAYTELEIIALTRLAQDDMQIYEVSLSKILFEQALSLFCADGMNANIPQHTVCDIYNRLTQITLSEDEIEIAEGYIVQFYEFAHQHQSNLYFGYSNRLIADYITKTGTVPDEQFELDADYYYNEAVNAFEKLNAEREVANTLLAHGESLTKRGDKRSASVKYQRAMEILTRLKQSDG